MGEIATSERQITLYCLPDSRRAKQTLAYARAEGLPIQTVNLLQNPPTGTQLVELAKRLGLEVKDLVNQDHPAYVSHHSHHDFNEDDWIKMIHHEPRIMKQPIALRGKRTILVETPTDIIKI